MTRPFEGIRIVDTTHVLAGPFATYQLAVLGADVVRVEHPRVLDQVREQGPDERLNAAGMGTYYLTQNAGKRSVTLDLADPRGREVLMRLLEGADVFVENYRPGALEALGLGYAALAPRFPRLVYCSISAFGQEGPRRTHTAYDFQIQATSGVMAATGTAVVNPIKVGAPVMDYGTGTMGAFAIAAALFQRQRTGRGQYIDMAMFDVALMLMSADVVNWLVGRAAPEPRGNDYPLAGARCYATAEGLLMLGAMNRRQHARLFELLGRPDIAAVTDFGPRFAQAEEQARFLAGVFAERTAAEWEDELQAHGIPAARVRTLPEALADPQLATRALLQRVAADAGNGRALDVPVTAFRFAHGGPHVGAPPPRAGEHTDAVLAELGYDAAAIAALRRDGVI